MKWIEVESLNNKSLFLSFTTLLLLQEADYASEFKNTMHQSRGCYIKRRDHSLCIEQLQLLLPIASAKIKKTEREVNAINVVFTIAAGNVGELSSFAAVYT